MRNYKEVVYFSEQMKNIYNNLVDDLSKAIFQSRFNYLLERNIDEFREELLEIIKKCNQKWKIYELDQIAEKRQIPGFIIFGCGVNGRYTYQLLKNSIYAQLPVFFCDNNQEMWGMNYMNEKVITPFEMQENYKEYICIIGSNRNLYDIWNQLIVENFPKENIIYPRVGVLYGEVGNQYFDYFEATNDEIFVDGGVFDGGSSLEFKKWTNGRYSKIYGFEANNNIYEKCKKIFDENLVGAQIYPIGLWSDKTKLCFDSRKGSASKISPEGAFEVNVDSIDNIIGDNRVSFIKMDIEGAESEALMGAQKLIKKYRPRMAISVYHKPCDIIEIPSIIMNIDSSYKFAIRQYSSIGDETILYAF